MKITKNKTAAILIAIFLTASVVASTMLIPNANAHTPAWNIPTFAFINAVPDPVGVGQKVSIIMWLTDTFDTSSAVTNDYRFHNYNLKITKPDGTTETHIFDVVIDTTSSQFYPYTPDQVGNYTFTFTFPGQAFNTYSYPATSALVNDTYLPSSASTTLTVQQEQLPAPITSYPLPSNYWSRPIYGENTDWWAISSNWLGTGVPGYGGFSFFGSNQLCYPGDAVGPQTSHVMWTKGLQSGGVIGGNKFVVQGDTAFEGSAYNQRFQNPIILNGKLYYTEPVSFTGASSGPTDCVDLQTGQLIWSKTTVPALSFGYLYNVQDPNQHGVYPAILFAAVGGGFFGGQTTWQAYDADTGNALFNVSGIPTGTTVLGPSGEMLVYVIANAGTALSPNWQLCEWNSSKLWDYTSLSPAISGTVNAAVGSRYDWNVSVSYFNTLPLSINPFTGQASISATQDYAFYNNMLIGYSGSLPSSSTLVFRGISSAPYTYFAINLNASKGAVGNLLWSQTVNAPSNNVTVLPGPADPTVAVFTEAYSETNNWVGYSMTTGQKLWGPTGSQTAFDYYGNPATPNLPGVAAYGKLYSSAFGGILYCYDLTNGNLLWTYGNGGTGNSTRAGFYNAYGDYPTFIHAIGNGVVYLVSTEHTITTPIYKGALARAVNATDGTEIWTLSDYTGEFGTTSYAIADGVATFFNGYDNQIYSVGRGPSALTVTAPNVAADSGAPVVIRGTVLDVSAGTKQNAQTADFPNGVPVASDASMKDWMGYVYQQKPLPTRFTGVPVTIDVLDSNGNYRNIGIATTDATGMYSLTWTPDIAGDFTVIATFHGTNGYWGSYSESTFNVLTAHPTTAPTQTAAPTMTDTYLVGSAIAIIVVIIIAAAVTILMVRKRP
jgi:hypothetical protein